MQEAGIVRFTSRMLTTCSLVEEIDASGIFNFVVSGNVVFTNP